jgi:hypothetical protein
MTLATRKTDSFLCRTRLNKKKTIGITTTIASPPNNVTKKNVLVRNGVLKLYIASISEESSIRPRSGNTVVVNARKPKRSSVLTTTQVKIAARIFLV